MKYNSMTFTLWCGTRQTSNPIARLLLLPAVLQGLRLSEASLPLAQPCWAQVGPRLAGFQEASVMLEAAVRWSNRAAEVVDIFATADANDRPIPEVGAFSKKCNKSSSSS